MSVDFQNSQTRLNLLRAFAGESQARNRYTFAAGKAKDKKLEVIQFTFLFTAGQEKEHAEIFYNLLGACSGQNIKIDGGYPIDIDDSVVKLLRSAQHNEYEEHDDVYSSFANTAAEEGFTGISETFKKIANIEKIHGDRFGRLADLLEQDKLFVSDIECTWVCLNCGHTQTGLAAPEMCPVCHHDKGYFIRSELILA